MGGAHRSWLVALLFLACAPRGSISLAPRVVEAARFGPCSDPRGGCNGVTVLDVAVDGDRIGILYAIEDVGILGDPPQFHWGVVWSEDRAMTWRHLHDMQFCQPLPFGGVPQSIAISGGLPVLVSSSDSDGPLGGTDNVFCIVDPTTGALRAPPYGVVTPVLFGERQFIIDHGIAHQLNLDISRFRQCEASHILCGASQRCCPLGDGTCYAASCSEESCCDNRGRAGYVAFDVGTGEVTADTGYASHDVTTPAPIFASNIDVELPPYYSPPSAQRTSHSFVMPCRVWPDGQRYGAPDVCLCSAHGPDALALVAGTCAAEADWPIPIGDVYSPIGRAAVPWNFFRSGESFAGMTFTDGSVTRAVHHAGGGRVEVLEVGPGQVPWGTVDRGRPGRLRSRYGDLVALAASNGTGTTTTLYAFSGSGFRATDLPTRPCPVGEDCGWLPPYVVGTSHPEIGTSLVWAEPLGGGDYLLVYEIDREPPTSAMRDYVLYTSIEHLGVGTGTAGGTPEQACARALACSSAFSDLGSCLQALRHTTETRYRAFVAATTCDELLLAMPTLRNGTSCAPDGQSCVADALVSCNSGTIYLNADCGEHGGHCSIDPSSMTPTCVPPGTTCPSSGSGCDAAGRAVSCTGGQFDDCPARGLTCDDSSGFPRCVASVAACTGTAGAVCDGSRVVQCGASVDVGEIMEECAQTPGFHCVVEGPSAMCEPEVADCDPVHTPPVCVGSHLRSCVPGTFDMGSLRDVDCAALGLTCTTLASGARCS